MRRTLAAVLLLLATAPAYAGGWLKTVAAAQKVAKEKNQLILVDMFAEWCGWCHRFEREVFPSAVFQQASADLVLLRLDTEDRGEGTKFAQKYSISSLPTFLLLTPDLSVAGIIRGYAPPGEFVRRLNETRKLHETFDKKLKNEASFAKDPAQRIQLVRELGERQDWARAEPRLKKLMTEKGIPVAVRDEAHFMLATIYAIQEKEDEALKVVRQLQAASKTGDFVERSRILAGKIHAQKGDFAKAITELREFKAAFPKSQHTREVDMMLGDMQRRMLSRGK